MLDFLWISCVVLITVKITTGIYLFLSYGLLIVCFLLCSPYSYETSDGVSRSESAQLKDVGLENPALQVRGTISWVAADGQQYTLNYVADENGFQPEGAHLPKA